MLKWRAGIRLTNYDVIILPLAEKDIAKNTDYIFYDKQSPAVALRLLTGFYRTIEKLQFMPNRYEVDEDLDLAIMKIRKCYYKNYKIFFYINQKEHKVFVLRVLHMLVDAKPLLLNMDI